MAHRPANKDLPSHRPSRQSLELKEPRPEDAKAQANYPQFLFRLESTPILCFLQLTRILNEPMFRLETKVERTKIERRKCRACPVQGAGAPSRFMKHHGVFADVAPLEGLSWSRETDSDCSQNENTSHTGFASYPRERFPNRTGFFGRTGRSEIGDHSGDFLCG